MNLLANLALIVITPVILDFFSPEIDAIKKKAREAWQNHKDAKD